MKSICSFILALLPLASVHAQQTVGRFLRDSASENGYVLFAPLPSTNTYLIDKCGKRVHTWTNTRRPGVSTFLLKNGTLLRPAGAGNTTFTAGGNGGIVELIDWNSSVQWSYNISSATECQHHDVYPMPNGNVLAVVWESKTRAEAIAAGRVPAQVGATIWSEKIVELQPTGATTANIVWEWHVWDHLVQQQDNTKSNYDTVSEHPELINLNYNGGAPMIADWLHINSVAYNPALDQIMLSVHSFDELWVIDHSTTTAQAATHSGGRTGKGGDLLYRWGNPRVYNRGTTGDQVFHDQHHAHWIEAGLPDSGKIMVFNNGQGRTGPAYSSVDVIDPPVDASGNYAISSTAAFGPSSVYWQYTAPLPSDFYSKNISGAYRLKSGNTLITSGAGGELFEIDTAKRVVWKYVNPVIGTGPISQGTAPTGNFVFRSSQYPVDYPGLAGKTLTPGAAIEINPLTDSCVMIKPPPTAGVGNHTRSRSPFVVVNPFASALQVKSTTVQKDVSFMLTTITGTVCQRWHTSSMGVNESMRLDIERDLAPGIYLLQIRGQGIATSLMLMH